MSPTAWGALKYTAKMLGLRKPHEAVDPQFMRPQGFYDPDDVDLKKLRRLIKHGKLAPCYPGRERADDEETEARPLDAAAAKGGDRTSSGDVLLSVVSTNVAKANTTSDDAGIEKHARAKPAASSATDKTQTRFPRALDECPICFMCYPCLNKSRCCSSEICTECYLRVLAPSNAPEEYDRAGRRLLRPPKCPFCKTEGYGVAFGGAKSDADRAAEAEERAALAKALEAARAADLTEQAERRARRASVEAQRASLSGRKGLDDPERDPPSADAPPRDGAPPDPSPSSGSSVPSSPVPVGWEAEYAAMTPPEPINRSNRVFPPDGDRARRSGGASSTWFGDARVRAPGGDATRDEEARRRAAPRRDRAESPASRDFFATASSSSRRGERRAFLPAGPAFLPRNPRNPEPFAADRGGGLGRRGGSSPGGALAREREIEARRSGGRAVSSSREERSERDERRVLRELARRADSRRERRRLAADRDASRGETLGDETLGAESEEAFLARVRDFIPARLLEASFGDLGAGDVDGEEALDVAASRAHDIDDVMMMEAVYLSLQEQEEATRRRERDPSGTRSDLARDAGAAAEAAEAAEVEEAIALVAAAEAAEAAERAGRSAATTTTARVDASREATEDAEGAGDVAPSGELEAERAGFDGLEAPEEVSVGREADDATDAAVLADDAADTGETDAFDAVDESLAALEAEASRITAHRLSSLSRRPAAAPAAEPEAAAAEGDAEKSSPPAPVPDADDSAYLAAELDPSASEAEPEAEAARAVANVAGAPRAGEKSAPEESATAPPAARSPETLPSAPGAGAGGGGGTDAVANTVGDGHASVERAPKSDPPDLPDVPSTRGA